MKFLRIIIIFFALFAASNASCQVVDSIVYGWKIYEYGDEEQGDKECYIFTYPQNSRSDHNQREKPYLMITRYQEGRTEEVSIYGGFEYKLNSEIVALIDNQQFKLQTKDDMAWATSSNDDALIIQKLLNAAILKVRSNSSISTFAIDEYSLKGITRAYARMRQICH
jgi:hypothetical protein